MTCIWNKTFTNNAIQFQRRFPELYSMLEPHFNSVKSLLAQKEQLFSENSLDILNQIFNFWQFSESRDKNITAKENGVLLHSGYSPIKEVQKLFSGDEFSDTETPWIFAGMGLGYAPVEFAKVNKDNLMIIIEPDPGFLFASMCVLDWSSVFSHEKCVIITNSTPEQIIPLLESLKAVEKAKIITQISQTNHQQTWFKNFFTLLERNRQKQNINTNTLERFASLWQKNSAKNLKYFSRCQGISIYKDMLMGKIPAIVCAAGPTLQETLTHIKQLKERAVIIAVDTALRALLQSGVQPDFILLIDPQYYAACHIQGLSSPQSVLITESSVYPSVMRFNCRKTVLIESLFPLGRWFEQNLLQDKSFGKIIAGGSVSTSAWEFAKYIGASQIYMAGLDLGYPQKKTHIKGSTFEEKSHSASTRLKTAENNLCSILFSAANEKSVDYDGNTIITDSKMKLFAWWFESQLAKEENIKSYSLSAKSLKIPGMLVTQPQELLDLKETRIDLDNILKERENGKVQFTEDDFNTVLYTLKSLLDELYAKAKRGHSICQNILKQGEFTAILEAQKNAGTLEKIDSYILNSEAKTVASLVFPTQRQLDHLMQEQKKYNDPLLNSIVKSSLIYSQLLKAISSYQKYL